MKYSLVSIPSVDVTGFPLLHLSVPDQFNTGGYCIPTDAGSVYVYSQIDLLVAGLESLHRNVNVYDLSKFFDLYRGTIMSSLSSVYLGYQISSIAYGDSIFYRPIIDIIANIQYTRDEDFLNVLRKNAPLTFKWVLK